MSISDLRIALLISGGGTTMREIIRATKDGRLPRVTPALVVASKPDAGGIKKAMDEGIAEKDIVVLRRRAFDSALTFGEAIIAACQDHRVDFVGQYGWLPITPPNVIEAYHGMIVNQHPGPLQTGRPDFGGNGMYGRRVHCARLLFVRSVGHPSPTTEVVAHRVYQQVDAGPVLHRAVVPITKDDDPISLQERALPEEHRVQIETLKMFTEGTVKEVLDDVPLVTDEQIPVLNETKRIAALLFPKG